MMHTHTHTQTYIHAHTHTHTNMHTHAHTKTYTYTYIYTHNCTTYANITKHFHSPMNSNAQMNACKRKCLLEKFK